MIPHMIRQHPSLLKIMTGVRKVISIPVAKLLASLVQGDVNIELFSWVRTIVARWPKAQFVCIMTHVFLSMSQMAVYFKESQ